MLALDSGFQTVDSDFPVLFFNGFQISCQWILGFQIPIVSWILDSLSKIPDSKSQDSGFHQTKIYRVPESGFPYFLILPVISAGPTAHPTTGTAHPTVPAIVSEEPVIRPAFCVPYRCVDKQQVDSHLGRILVFFLLAGALLHFIQTRQL